jgi:hypothetical protein
MTNVSVGQLQAVGQRTMDKKVRFRPMAPVSILIRLVAYCAPRGNAYSWEDLVNGLLSNVRVFVSLEVLAF